MVSEGSAYVYYILIYIRSWRGERREDERREGGYI